MNFSLRDSGRVIILVGRLGGDKLEDKGDKASGRRTHHPTKGNKGDDKLGDKPGDKLEDKLGDKGDKTSGRWAHHPTKGNKKEDKLVHKLGDKRDKDSGRADIPSNKGKQEGRQRETRGKADTPSNKGKQEGRQAGRPAGRRGR